LKQECTNGTEFGLDGEISRNQDKQINTDVRETLQAETESNPNRFGIICVNLRSAQRKEIGMGKYNEKHGNQSQ
jgi:hypothetical protein